MPVMERQELRDGLMAIGLTQYEADAYAALLELGCAPAVDVAQTADVPRARIYDVVRSLAEKGYVETFEDDGLHAQAIDPSGVLKELETAADRLESTADEVEERWEEPSITNRQISVVKRFETLYRIARERIEQAEFEVKLGATPEQYAELADVLESVREEGVVVKVTLHGGGSQEVGAADELRDLVDDVPTETRVRNLPSSLLVVIDHREVIFAPSHTLSVGEQGLFFDDIWFAEMADWYFRTAVWAVWEPIQNTREEPPAAYTDIRECLRSIGPAVDDGETLRAAATPFDSPERRIEGRIVDTTYQQSGETTGSALEPYVSIASLTLETDDGETYTVGNWDAVVEDVAAGRIDILAA
jgi:sugar-specific transcriptional regulator TrmB